jgi:hypothetical protein
MAEMAGEKFVSPGLSIDAGADHRVKDGKTAPFNPSIRGMPGGRNNTVEYNEDSVERVSVLKKLAPPWGGGAGGAGMAVVNYR